MTHETIKAAAIMHNGDLVTLPPPARHHTIIRHIFDAGHEQPGIQPKDQGFVTSTGRFVERAEALRIAVAAGQPIIRADALPVHVGQYLFSEDLW